MSHFNNTYDLEKEESGQDLKFLFMSQGKQDVIKVIEYSFVQELGGKNVYNLGFGDYDIDNDKIVDNVNTNNNDVYRVFNTVLSTIPIFFEKYENSALVVHGSDGRPEFIEICRTTCTKRCKEECKNYNRRINIYKNYIDKNYEDLNIDYQFVGGFRNEKGRTLLESYECQKNYDLILLFKKNV